MKRIHSSSMPNPRTSLGPVQDPPPLPVMDGGRRIRPRISDAAPVPAAPTTVFHFMRQISAQPAARAPLAEAVTSPSPVRHAAPESEDRTFRIDDADWEFAVWIKLSADGERIRIAAVETGDEDETRQVFLRLDADPDTLAQALANRLRVRQGPLVDMLEALATSGRGQEVWDCLTSNPDIRHTVCRSSID